MAKKHCLVPLFSSQRIRSVLVPPPSLSLSRALSFSVATRKPRRREGAEGGRREGKGKTGKKGQEQCGGKYMEEIAYPPVNQSRAAFG